MRNIICGLLLMACCFANGKLLAADDAKLNNVGASIADFSLHDFRGKIHSLKDFDDHKLLVVAFVGNDCPLAKLYAPRLELLAREFTSKGVAFLAINSNRQDQPTQIATYARKHNVSFPILKDAGNKVADLFDARRTPDLFDLDASRTIRYRGRIDDQFGIGFQRKKAERQYLATAIEELLAGKPVSVSYTDPVGCLIGRVPDIEPHGDITYTKDIAPILNRRCVECHREGELGPFSLTSYEEVVGWGAMIHEVVDEGRMPPWFADPRFGHFSNSSQMSDEEKQILFDWVENGCPEGDPADLPEPVEYASGWRIGKPDAVYSMEKEFTIPAEGTVDYQNFLVDPRLEEGVWLSMAEARPGNHEVVHHIVVYAVPAESREAVMELIREQRAEDGLSGEKVDEKSANQANSNQKRPRKKKKKKKSNRNPFKELVAIYAPGMPP